MEVLLVVLLLQFPVAVLSPCQGKQRLVTLPHWQAVFMFLSPGTSG